MHWLDDSILSQALTHARQDAPRESCGLVVLTKGRARYWPCANKATGTEGEDYFVLDPLDYAAAEDAGAVLAVVHSHPKTHPAPTSADRVGMEATGLPWLILNPETGGYTLTEPSGYEAPLLGRPFVHAVFDCGSLVRDYYNRAFGLELRDYPREDYWWLKGFDLYRETLPKEGFACVETPEPYDLALIALQAEVPSHAGVLLPGNLILHHVRDRLSSRDVYDGYFRKHTLAFWRHPAVHGNLPAFQL